MLLHLLSQHGRVLHGVPHQEGPAKAGAERRLRLCHSHLGTRYLHAQPSCLAKMWQCPLPRRRQDITGQCLEAHLTLYAGVTLCKSKC